MSESSQYAPSKKPLPGMATPSTPPLERRRRGRAARPAGPPSQHQHNDEPWANSWAHKRMHELFASQQPPQAAFAAQHPSYWMPPAPQQTLALVPGSTRRTSHDRPGLAGGPCRRDGAGYSGIICLSARLSVFLRSSHTGVSLARPRALSRLGEPAEGANSQPVTSGGKGSKTVSAPRRKSTRKTRLYSP